VTLKTLVTGVAAAALVGGAAAGVTSIAFSAGSSAPGAVAVQPVVWDIPMPQAPPAQLEAPLLQTLHALAGGGSFVGKGSYIQGGIGRIEGIAADRAYNLAAAEGKFPLTFNVANIDSNDWMTYPINVPKTGWYNLQFRVASPNNGGQLVLRSGHRFSQLIPDGTAGLSIVRLAVDAAGNAVDPTLELDAYRGHLTLAIERGPVKR